MPAVSPRRTYTIEIPVPTGFGDTTKFEKISQELNASIGGILRFEISLGYGHYDWVVIEGTGRVLRDSITWLRTNRHITPATMSTAILDLQDQINRT